MVTFALLIRIDLNVFYDMITCNISKYANKPT